MNLGRFARTVRHLQLTQIVNRVWRQAYSPVPDCSAAPSVAEGLGTWRGPYTRQPSLKGEWRFSFLNTERMLESAADWNRADWEKLWLYNLHYFDDLNAEGGAERAHIHEALMEKWIRENPPGTGVGWEPYPTSIRIVNWIKWAMRGGTLSPAAVESIAVQSRWLAKRLEYHLLGNHLFANAKALFFAGSMFDGKESQRWRDTGQSIVEKQLEEQVLADGGHFERSPMYHALFLEDLLDLLHLHECLGKFEPFGWRSRAQLMHAWLRTMRHPDGEVPFFNDAVVGTAAPPRMLDAYAGMLGLADESSENPVADDLRDSGYVRVRRGAAVAFMDTAPIGPDYLPGHAHADTLSFELSIQGQRVLVNRGISEYQQGETRIRERATAAHNCLELDGENSSEVWSAFRVGRRARVKSRSVTADGQLVRVSGCHDGYQYLPGNPIHCRDWEMNAEGLHITDQITGTGRHDVSIYLHIHPSLRARRAGDYLVDLLEESEQRVCTVEFDETGTLSIEDDYHAIAFGMMKESQVLRYRAHSLDSHSGSRFLTRVLWTAPASRGEK